LSHGFQKPTKESSSQNSTQGILGFLRAYLGCLLKPMAQNYQYILSFFAIAILCAKISSIS